MDRLVNAVVRGNSAAVVPLLLRSSIARPACQRPLYTAALPRDIPSPFSYDRRRIDHGTANVQPASVNHVDGQPSKRLVIIQAWWLTAGRKTERNESTERERPGCEPRLSFGVQQACRTLSTSTIQSPPSTVTRIASQWWWWWWWHAWNDRSSTRYVCAVYVCAARAPIMFATRSEWHCSSLPVHGPLPLSGGQGIVARPRPPPNPRPSVERGLGPRGLRFVEAAEWAEFIARLTPRAEDGERGRTGACARGVVPRRVESRKASKRGGGGGRWEGFSMAAGC